MKIRGIIASLLVAALFIAASSKAQAQESVATVEEPVTLSQKGDFHITSSTPFGAEGKIDITGEESWIIFDKVIPSQVNANYLGHITVNGEAAVKDKNVMVSIYNDGAVLIPHGTDYCPLTVYTQENFEGDSKGDFVPFTYYKSLGTFNNKIKSFKLKRGYMVTFANNASGTGYSRCYIADDQDIEVASLPGELKGKVSFIRIFRWRWVSKKGYAGGDRTALDILNTTWYYDWNVGGVTEDDYEYVPHRHHIGWPSYSDIEAKNNVTHVLGNNEPDNTGDDREQYKTVDEVLADWENMYHSGLRVGSPACTSANSWLYSFVDSCDARGYRLDFVALHCYWYNDASSWRSQLTNIYNRVKRPLWITEWNYGANWTGNPFNNVDNPTASDYNLFKQKIREIIAVLEELPFVERYAFYNWVQEARKFYKGDYELTPAGELYAAQSPGYFFNRSYEVVTKPVYKALGAISRSFDPKSRIARISWSDPNGELTDSTLVTRKKDDGDFKTIATIYNSANTNYAYQDTVPTEPGTYTYRVVACSADGRDRLSGETYVSLAGSQGTAEIQYGTIDINDCSYSYNFFGTPYGADDELPAVFLSPITNNNAKLGACTHLYKVNADYFQFRLYPWKTSKEQEVEKSESCNYMAVAKGNGYYGALPYECAQLPDKVAKDTVEVTFNVPFAPGTQPIVLLSVATTRTSYPIMWKVWDVTNTGFKMRLIRESTLSGTFLKENVSYFAIAQGEGLLPDGRQITASRDETPIRNILRTIKFGQQLPNPTFFAGLQSAIDNNAAVLRYNSLKDSSVMIRRQIEENNPDRIMPDTVGWIVISDLATSIESPAAAPAALALTPVAHNRYSVQAAGANSLTLYSASGLKVLTRRMEQNSAVVDLTALPAGTYVLRTDNGRCKLIMKK